MNLASISPLLAVLLLTAGTCAAAQDHLQTLPVRELQRLFLTCERQASQTMMGAADAAACSRAYEELLKRGFDGDFRRLLVWWQAERAAALAVATLLP